MSKEVLARHWQELKNLPNVINLGMSTKKEGGRETGKSSITVYVKKKVPLTDLKTEETVPLFIEGVPTDVVEVAPTTWVADKTSVSELHPEIQRRLLGLKGKPLSKPSPRRFSASAKVPSGASALTKWASPVQDQKNCGSCTAHGNIGVGEGVIRIAANDYNACPKLSESHLFRCSGGLCQDGNTVEATLDQFMKGVCAEECLPYQDIDQPCGAGMCPNWWLQAKRIKDWNSVSDPTEQKVLLDTVPLNATMAVYQSFLNYVSGVYSHLPGDLLLGYHDIACYGYDDSLKAKLIRNSWNTGWGQGCMVNGVLMPGYCWIAEEELDPEMQQLIPDGPVPPPPPIPEITSVAPNSGQQGETFNVTIIGSDLAGVTLVDFGSGISTTIVGGANTQQIVIAIVIAGDAALGARDVSVTTPGGVATLPSGFMVTLAPVTPWITSITPKSGEQGQSLQLTIAGRNLAGATSIDLGSGIATTGQGTVVSDTQIVTNISIPADAALGVRSLAVTTPNGIATLANAFTVTSAPTPSPCKIGNGYARFHNFFLKAARRKGRLFYRIP